MVVHEIIDTPLKVAITKTQHMEDKKYVIVKNHVRELNSTEKYKTSSARENSPEVQKQLEKSSKKRKLPKLSSEDESISHSHETEISPTDLEELRNVYKKCKAVMNKIEKKYGHLLNLEEPGPNQAECEEKCYCIANTKIVFDENGEQVIKESVLDHHICHKRLKEQSEDGSNLQIELFEDVIPLPDDLPALANILIDPHIKVSHRNAVIDKMRLIKQEHLNNIKFQRPSMKDKLKINPEEILDFKGTNLSTLAGYPDWK